MPIRRPMKAPTDSITDDELKSLHYPIVGSPKVDGFRCLVDKAPLTSSMKPFTNKHVVKVLSNPIYEGFDGEIVVGSPFKENEDDDVFNRTSGPVRRFDGEPDFSLYVFDNWLFGNQSYKSRWIDNLQIPYNHSKQGPTRIIVLEQKILT